MRTLCAHWFPYRLKFNFTAKTSRMTMHEKKTYFIVMWYSDSPEIRGIGECALFEGLSAEDNEAYETILEEYCQNPMQPVPEVSSIRFGVTTALRDLGNGGNHHIFSSPWTEGKMGIQINGLIWMGDRTEMLTRIRHKLEDGFRVLKMKIGGIDFESEMSLLKYVRQYFSEDSLTIRLDANGSFTPDNVMKKLERISAYRIHSIEQPLKQGLWEETARVCENSPVPIALDEELIGYNKLTAKRELLDFIKPQYIILKPSLCGGFEQADEWITECENRNIGWWATSALESDIGLNAIAQWCATKNNILPQGLGTGMLYNNNVPSPLELRQDYLFYNTSKMWGHINRNV